MGQHTLGQEYWIHCGGIAGWRTGLIGWFERTKGVLLQLASSIDMMTCRLSPMSPTVVPGSLSSEAAWCGASEAAEQSQFLMAMQGSLGFCRGVVSLHNNVQVVRDTWSILRCSHTKDMHGSDFFRMFGGTRKCDVACNQFATVLPLIE